jgi:hypothetical protein
VASGKRRAERHSHAGLHLGPLSRLGATVLAMAIGGFAWWYLVRAAIAFGRVARSGEQGAWMFTASAAIGAMLCLLLVIVLASRVLVTLGVVSDYHGRRSSPRRAAPRRTAETAPRRSAETAPRRTAEAAPAPGRRAAGRDAPQADGSSG